MRKKRYVNSIGMKFVRIPAGTFVMGETGDRYFFSNERPAHHVTIPRDFYLSVTSVTREQLWKVCSIDPGPEHFDGDHGDFPVCNASFFTALFFCEELSKLEKKQYRLPTEAEWEYACRGGAETAFCFGNSVQSLSRYGWSAETGTEWPQPVGLLKPNKFGLYDMHGNVWEWCSNPFQEYGDQPVIDRPIYVSIRDLEESEPLADRVLRGGSFESGAGDCRSARRMPRKPDSRTLFAADSGFRVALSID